MTEQGLIDLIDQLRSEPSEREWLEFKRNNYAPQVIGEYLSALSNSAAWKRRAMGYLVFGIDNDTHDVVGTTFDPYTQKAKGNQDLLIWLNTSLDPNPGFDVDVVDHPGGRVVLFSVRPARGQPVYFKGKDFIRIGTSKTELRKHPEAMKAIVSAASDWSAEICGAAELDDLDAEAVKAARKQFRIKQPRLADDVASWSDEVFLNKAKLTIKGAVTNTALLLLGHPESSTLLPPAVARISWILKDSKNTELDYEHFDPPFLLQVDRVVARIRNLTLRAMPSGTLFPREFTQYEPWVLREALHNCIAHQDYGLYSRIVVVETPDRILFSNVGDFLPGDVETVVRQDAPQMTYRNPFLTAAMVNLNMIDTQGGGIKKMYLHQKNRFFPLPDYELSDAARVSVSISGAILDERYCRLLMAEADLDLDMVILLDKVQKKVRISKGEHKLLKKAGLVEGRYPNLYVAAEVAKVTGGAGRHIRERGFDTQYYLDLIVKLVRAHEPVSRLDVDEALLSKLPDRLSPEQKKRKVKNLLQILRRKGVIVNEGPRAMPKWVLASNRHISKES